MSKVRRGKASPEQVFDFIQKFNQVVTLDEEFARQLPSHEFELSFNRAGGIYIDGEPLGVNIEQRHRSLRRRASTS